MSGPRSDVVADSLLLLELALMVGRTLEYDLEQRCQEFLHVLMARKNLSYGAVWIRSSALRRDGDDRKVELVFALPRARAKMKEISTFSPGMVVLRENRFHVIRDTDPGFSSHVLESNTSTGSIASFRLGNIGVLRLHSIKQNSFSIREINQLFGVIEIFSISIEGALSQRRLQEEAKARELMEAQLHQAEKLNAIGQLTGGIAHDFNNLLAVIGNSAEFLQDEPGHDHDLVRTILRATNRGAELTHRLLAFSRRQPLRTKSIALATLVEGMSDLLRRTLGETIEVGTIAEPDLWPVAADPGQVENAFLNLSINARDAMPGGGKLLIECRNIHLDEAYVAENTEASVGDFVILTVTDNGFGMTDDVRAHAFEPFFTTKEVGKGSGLGLSMIYGFAKQSGGHVDIYSEEGRGTAVKLYLPRDETVAPEVGGNEKTEAPGGRGEAVLVIEDNPAVRELAVKMLMTLGYRATDVPDVTAARAALDSRQKFDLMLSDVVLPGGMSGPEFAEEVRARFPDLKIIFMSGYPAEAAKRNGFLGSDRVLLNKPFRRSQLAKALRDALDQGAPE